VPYDGGLTRIFEVVSYKIPIFIPKQTALTSIQVTLMRDFQSTGSTEYNLGRNGIKKWNKRQISPAILGTEPLIFRA
jgi:hypothetical protein